MKRTIYLCLCFYLLTSVSCLRKQLALPPDRSHEDPGLTVTHTIAALRKLNGAYSPATGGDTTLLTQEIVVSGVVTANDQTGNFYKQLIVQDSTGAIMLLMDGYNLYNRFPIGRKVYVRCRGLWLGYDAGLPVLGGMPDEHLALQELSGQQLEEAVVPADVGHEVVPDTFELVQLRQPREEWYHRLVYLREAQFRDTGARFAQPNADANRSLFSCLQDSILLRTSNYAGFSQSRLPAGRGGLTAIYSVYVSSVSGKATPQLLLRDTSDIRFSMPRCGGSEPAEAAQVSVEALRALYQGKDVALGSMRICGIVISDAAAKNTSSNNLVLQDGNTGILLYCSGATDSQVGDSVQVDVSGLTLTQYQGAKEIKTVAKARIRKLKSGCVPPERRMSLQEVSDRWPLLESTLVTVPGAEIRAGGTYSGNKTLSDGSGQDLILFTSPSAEFAAQPVPAGTHRFRAIVTPYNSVKELKLRNPGDVD